MLNVASLGPRSICEICVKIYFVSVKPIRLISLIRSRKLNLFVPIKPTVLLRNLR